MKPILFNTEMVRAILEGRKTVTRRTIKDKDIINGWDCEADGTPVAHIDQATGDSYPPTALAPYQPGDILWVRETWCEYNGYILFKESEESNDPQWMQGKEIKWRPSIHMPKEAARLFLRVKAVRVERLQDITEEECAAEGVVNYWVGMGESGYAIDADFKTSYEGPIGAFVFLIWEKTIKPADLPLYGWTANPWVWVIEFERISGEEAQGGGGDVR